VDNKGGVPLFNITNLGVGTHFITAQYSGDKVYAATTSAPPLRQTVNGSGSNTVAKLTVDKAAITVGDTVTFTVLVTYGGVPVNAGNVTITDKSNHVYGTANVGTDGKATVPNSTLAAGQYTVLAVYGGNPDPLVKDVQSNTVTFTVSVAGGSQAPRLTIEASMGPADGDLRPLWLTFKNAASAGAARQITLTATSFRVIGGAGDAVVASPTLPMVIGDLAPGKSTIVTLLMHVPTGAKELAVTDTGVYQGVDGTQYRFSLGQVVFPQ
jgi:hypothetical protein